MKRILIALSLCLMAVTTLQAQTPKKPNTGAKQGIVKDSTNLGVNYGNTTAAPTGRKVPNHRGSKRPISRKTDTTMSSGNRR